ncbi:MAG: phosphate butyryltransferase, partial [Alistipes sp.]|nr:phosphate butyryltransferase [Alistipes sp.]
MITRLDEIVAAAVARGRKRLAVAYGQDTHTIEAVYNAWKEGLVEATLFGDKATIEQACTELGIDSSVFNIVHEPSDVTCVKLAVQAVVNGQADVLMKGLVSTDKYMRGILNKEAGLF